MIETLRQRRQNKKYTAHVETLTRAKLAAAVRPCLESLERRQLLSAGDVNLGPLDASVRGFKFDYRNDVAVQSDGKMLIAGYVGTSGLGTGRDIAVARYNADGTIDAAYGTGGVAVNAAAGGDHRLHRNQALLRLGDHRAARRQDRRRRHQQRHRLHRRQEVRPCPLYQQRRR